MIKNLLLFVLIVLLIPLVWFRTPVSQNYYLNKGIQEYNAENYTQAVSSFERILSVDKTNQNARFYYVRSLAKLEPVLSVQKKLYDIANSDIKDDSTEFAKAQIISLKHKFIEGLEDNYIFNAISGKDIVRWDINSFPLKVYVEQASDIPSYYLESVDKALEQWVNRSGFIKFEKAQSPQDADINIIFKDFEGQCNDNTDCRFAIAYTEPVIKNGKLQKMNLTFHKTNPRKQEFSQIEVFNTAIHELGHTLGIMGHSDNSDDVMYANNDKSSDIYSQYRSDSQYLSTRDLKTLVLLYRLSPTITNTNDTDNKSYYYSPIVLGNSDEVLEKKLTELKRYIQNYPTLSVGYINISSVYADMGDYENALSSLETAMNYASNDDDKYLILYNKTVIYINSQNYQKAMEYANQAKSIKDTPDIENIIQELNTVLK